MKVVIDTNVFISGIFWKGSPHKVLTLWVKNKIKLIATKKILIEYFRVLYKIDNNKKLSEKWHTFVLKNSLIVKDIKLIQFCRDPEDNKFLNCAIAGRADYLISGDKDLLSLKTIKSTKITTPAEFLISVTALSYLSSSGTE